VSCSHQHIGWTVTSKELIIVGGPNGAGKTTFADEYVAQQGHNYIGADAIAYELSPQNPNLAQFAAGREFLRRIDAGLKGSESLVVESTLSGRTIRHTLQKAKTAGFMVEIVYLFLESADTCVERIRQRVQKGGHFVPEADVRRRFTRSILNFWNLYRPLSHRWTLVYNAGGKAHNVAVGAAADYSVRDIELFDQFQQLVKQAK